MKKYLFLIVAILLAVNSYGQKFATKPFKGALKIIVVDSLSATENLKLAGQLLIDAGYFIAKKDSEYNTIESQPIYLSLPGMIKYSQTIYIIAKDRKVALLSKGRSGAIPGPFQNENDNVALDFLKWKNNDLQQECFRNMLMVASHIPNSTITYSE